MKYYSLQCKKDLNGKYGQINDGIIIEKKSKFISYLFNINSEEEAIEKIEQIRRDNGQARHVVYIYSLLKGSITDIKFSDDGEPQGTGTKAIYELLNKESITNVCIVIVRYFGGILLGAGPLSRTYLNSARICIDECIKKEIYNFEFISCNCSYNAYNILKNRLQLYVDDGLVQILNCNFSDNVEVSIKVVDFKKEEIEKIIEEVCYGY